MKNPARILSAVTVASIVVGAFTGTASAELNALPCVSGGPTSADSADASALNPVLANKMRGHMTAYNTSCARAVVERVKVRGFNQRAAAIALATTIVESSNANLDGGDLDSVGLYQQRESWGSFAERTNPQIATDKFLDTMTRFYPNGSWNTAAIGDVAADVQRPREDLRFKYGVEANDAVKIANHLWPTGVNRGKADLMRANADGSLTAWQNNGVLAGGSWAAPATAGNAGTVEHARLKYGDLNADGKADLVRVNADGSMTAWQNNAALGGSWAAPVTAGNAGGGDSTRVRLADLNGDNKADLIVINGDGSLTAWQNNNALGGSWAAPVMAGNVGTTDQSQVRFGDLNGDGKADLIRVAPDGGMTGWLNNNALGGSWSAPAVLGNAGAGGTAGVRLADLNADGKADLIRVGTDGGLTAWLNNNAYAGSWAAPAAIGNAGTTDPTRAEFADLG
ncbi:VCBS repeat protein [Lentzea atacamensis]|uniref:VCBS repeat protein n=1 Tax=Lentzea atacamensis TaxID=531938 RepID=A0A316HZD4_9PSEU|nr:VCBS repeat-containing protein [Lentzea atacamensis]PWK86519.1 VCBS repeat protein [Lentzea atacamensis]